MELRLTCLLNNLELNSPLWARLYRLFMVLLIHQQLCDVGYQTLSPPLLLFIFVGIPIN